jgi:hypothetical protein
VCLAGPSIFTPYLSQSQRHIDNVRVLSAGRSCSGVQWCWMCVNGEADVYEAAGENRSQPVTDVQFFISSITQL